VDRTKPAANDITGTVQVGFHAVSVKERLLVRKPALRHLARVLYQRRKKEVFGCSTDTRVVPA
jgi:hypothetical protein